MRQDWELGEATAIPGKTRRAKLKVTRTFKLEDSGTLRSAPRAQDAPERVARPAEGLYSSLCWNARAGIRTQV
jgi:hypothetical protein